MKRLLMALTEKTSLYPSSGGFPAGFFQLPVILFPCVSRKHPAFPERFIRFMFALICIVSLAVSPALAETRVLLLACRDFLTAPSLGFESSGNLQMLAACFSAAGIGGSRLHLEDGTVATREMLGDVLHDCFGDAEDADLSILYICTHGIRTEADEPAILLSDGVLEELLSAQNLALMLNSLPGEKLLILDACFSGALIGRGSPYKNSFSGSERIHVLTSASGGENTWYAVGNTLAEGSLSYFVFALSKAAGLFGTPEADADRDGMISLSELILYLRFACSVSVPQLFSPYAERIILPAASPAYTLPLSSFSWGSQLLDPQSETLSVSFTVRDDASVSYRIVQRAGGEWDWAHALICRPEETALGPGRVRHELSLQGTNPGSYLLLQVYASVYGTSLLCDQRLYAALYPSAAFSPPTAVSFSPFGLSGAMISINAGGPALCSCRIETVSDALVSTLCDQSLMFPERDGCIRLYWDGHVGSDQPVPPDPLQFDAMVTDMYGRTQRFTVPFP